jgi:hypothetical protein
VALGRDDVQASEPDDRVVLGVRLLLERLEDLIVGLAWNPIEVLEVI